MITERCNELWKVRNQIRELLAEHNCHIETGHTFAYDCYFLCANEEHDIKEDVHLQIVNFKH